MQKVGILGGGQLGRMLLQASINYPVETFVMENDNDCPSAHLCDHFVKGNIQNFDDVFSFGKGLDAITIEIESVNEEALKKLEDEGVRVYPSSAALSIIKNKILQKKFYKENDIPTSDFVVTNSAKEISDNPTFFPAIHKIALGGYDGKGVVVINSAEDSHRGFDTPAVLEKKINIAKEISIIVASNGNEIVAYPPVEMVFNPSLNLLDYQIAPAYIDVTTIARLESIAMNVVKKLKSAGIFAVEMFIDKENNIWVNETAPRVHNSGHHTIEASYSSQFDMMWRILLNYPLGNTASILPAGIVNIIGEDGYAGTPDYQNLSEVLKIKNAFVHLYGKKNTKPGRKMGHVTIISNKSSEIISTAGKIKQLLKVISK